MTRTARLAGGIVVAALLLVFTAQAQAASFTVGNSGDTATCQSPPSGNNCTLRQLVTTVPAGSTIVVPASLSPYMLTAGELSISQSMTIMGDGARTTEIEQHTSSGNARVFDVQPGVTATISGLTMLFGKAVSTSPGGAVGGDVLNQGTLTLSEDFILDGQATGGSGGGISNQRAGATLTVTHSLIENNASVASSGVGGLAGGIENFTTRLTAAHLAIDNSTIVGNTAAAGGGGVTSDCAGPCTSTTTISNSTVASNDGGTAAPNAGGLLATAGTISVLNSIVASNTVSSFATPSNCAGGALITSLGHNIETATDCGFTSNGDHQSTDPGFLSGLSDYGGNTDTFALKATSPAVDAIPPGAPGCSGTDQRDIPRPQGSGCDIGAFELFQPVEGQAFTTVVGAVSGTSVSIDWGDGSSTPATSGQVTGTHTYAEEGVYHAVIDYRNSDNTPLQFPFDVKVQDAALTASPVGITAIAGAPFNGQAATVTDADPAGTGSDYAATINWGDGSVSPGTVTAVGGGFGVSGTHTYTQIGSYATTVSIIDSGGATTIAHGTATVGTTPGPVLTGAPPAVGATTAAFAGSVNSEGLPTTAFFQYGLDPKYTGAGPIAFTQSTTAQPVGSDFASHFVSASVTGLVPNALYHVRLVASNSAGTALGPDVTFTTLKTPPPGPPKLGKTFNLTPVSGVVLILVNGQLIPLTEGQQFPKNTEIDALHGTLSLTTALPGGPGGARDAAAKGKKRKARTQNGTFGGAIFKISQATAGAGKGLVTLAIVENAFKGAPSFATCKVQKALEATAASSSTLQLLHASAKGKFRTKGRYSAATVLGTKWTVADRCDGTLTHDITDSVSVTDFVHHKTVVLHAGQSYLAKAPKHK